MASDMPEKNLTHKKELKHILQIIKLCIIYWIAYSIYKNSSYFHML
jgi:hypothetical protein